MKSLSIIALIAATATPALAASTHQEVSGYERRVSISANSGSIAQGDSVFPNTQLGTAPNK